jgi:iron(III) transport system substrate-binding protein
MLTGCVPRSESEVVVYASVDREYAGPIFDAFERTENAPSVARQFDVESSKSVGLANRILQEKSRPKCDLFWNGEILQTIRLQKAGLLRSRNWNLPTDWPKSTFAASDGTWVGVGARARVLLVNKKLLSKNSDGDSDWPTTVSELSNPKWKKKCGLAKPLYGTTATHFLVLAQRSTQTIDNNDGFSKWIEEVAENAVVLSGNKQVAQAVSSGQLAWGLTDTDDAQIEIDNGADVEMVYPDQGVEGDGCLLIPTTVSLLKGSPHPVAADLLANYLASKSVESRLTMGNAAAFALWPGSDISIANQQAKIRFMKVDFEAAADLWEATYEKLRNAFP